MWLIDHPFPMQLIEKKFLAASRLSFTETVQPNDWRPDVSIAFIHDHDL